MPTFTQNKVRNMKTPLLSIIIPTYNCEAYLSECLDSVLSQLPKDCELIVVDDGSEDGTKKLLASREGIQPNLHILYNRHCGASGARNAGLNAAKGEYVAFVDCDDCLKEGFLEQSLTLTAGRADLYIFGIERILLDGTKLPQLVEDNEYPDVSAFADDYIRKRRLLIYSNCNKFYRRSVIEKQNLRFDEQTAFGEDRLFNFHFLDGCGAVVTSSLIMLNYLQRSLNSMSSRYIPGYFDLVMGLHQAKMDCFFRLSAGTTAEERRAFENYDISREIEKTIARFSEHPEEGAENLAAIRRFLTEKDSDINYGL